MNVWRQFVIVVTGVVFSLLPLTALAQTTPLRISTSPIPISLITAPGTSISTPLRIKNEGDRAEQLKVEVMKFSTYDDTGHPRLGDLAPSDQFGSWLSFSENNFTIDAGEWKTITATFSVPPEASFGYYYAIVFSRVNTAPVASGQAVIEGGSAILVLLEARVPNAVRSIEVVDFSVDHPWYEFLPVKFTVKLRNNGTVHVAPRGNIFLRRGDEGKEVGILEVNDVQGNILPDSVRIFNSEWHDGFPVYQTEVVNGEVVLDDTGTQAQKLTWDFTQAHKLRWGKYTATMLLAYDDGQRDVPIEGKISFWVIPWRIGSGVLIVTLFALFGFYSTVRRMLLRIRKRR